MFRNYELKTSWKRVLVALISGAGLGAAIIAGYFLVGTYLSHGGEYLVKYALATGAGVFLYAFFAWGVGLVVIGGPAWSLLHFTGYRTWLVALLLGFCLPFVVFFLINTEFLTGYREGWSSYSQGGRQWLDGRLTGFGWWMAAVNSAVMGAFGALVALLTWKIAYGGKQEMVPDE